MITSRSFAPFLICHAPKKGVVARYHLDKVEIDNQLATLRAQGADGISLSIWLLKGADNELFLNWSSGVLAPQNQTNLINLLIAIKAHGFNWVQIAPQFYGPNDFRQWPTFNEGLYQENKSFLFGLPMILNQIGLPYLIDLCAEVDNGPYPQRLWVDWTCWFWPGGVPCWDATMSFRPDPGSILDLPLVFSDNIPAILLPHIYRGEQQQVYDTLKSAGIDGFPWIIGECYSLPQPSDVSIAQGLGDFVRRTKQPILRVCPWPVSPRTVEGTQIDLVPPNPGQVWIQDGF